MFKAKLSTGKQQGLPRGVGQWGPSAAGIGHAPAPQTPATHQAQQLKLPKVRDQGVERRRHRPPAATLLTSRAVGLGLVYVYEA